MVVKHVFPADAEYVFELTFTGGDNSRLEDVDLSIDGERVALVRYETGQAGAADGRGAMPMQTEPILVKAGQHAVSAAFVRRFDGPYEDMIRPHDWSFAGGGSGGSGDHDAAAPARRDHSRPVQGDRHLRHAEPPARSSPAGRPARPKSGRARGRSSRSLGDRGVSPAAVGAAKSTR